MTARAPELFDLPEARQRGTSIAGPHSGRALTHDWITPRFLIDALGPFDLDPCASKTQPWPCAARSIVQPRDGLAEPWAGRVWLNPPYSVHASDWLGKLKRHGRGTALIFARTDTEMFFAHVWGGATAILFLQGRLHFHHPDGRRADANAGGPSCLIAYGNTDAAILRDCGLPGAFVSSVEVLEHASVEARSSCPPETPLEAWIKGGAPA